MYPEPTELLLIGCLTDLIRIPKFKLGMSTPNTRLQTFWVKDTSHVTNGLIFSVCSTSTISALSAAPRISAWCTERMAKRMQEQSEENSIVAKSRPTAMNLTSSVATSSSSVNNPIASRSPGYSRLQVDRLDYQGGLMQAHIKIPILTQRSFFSHSDSCLKIKIFVVKSDVFGEAWGGPGELRGGKTWKKNEKKKNEKNQIEKNLKKLKNEKWKKNEKMEKFLKKWKWKYQKWKNEKKVKRKNEKNEKMKKWKNEKKRSPSTPIRNCGELRYGTHVNKPNGEWNRVADIMMINFAESGHPMLQSHQSFGKMRIEE